MPPATTEFDPAVAWFRARLPVTDDEYELLSGELRDLAFRIADVAQIDLVTQVWQALDRAIASGTTLEDFKHEIGEQLESAWGEDEPWRTETIFRTWVQRAYGAGRYALMTDELVREMRPFWRFVSVLDNRTSPICEELDGTTRPADDTWWKEHNPPLHHRCRSTVVSLTPEEAAEEGLTEDPPPIRPAPGFGRPPIEPWEPDWSKYPPPLLNVLQRKKAA